MNLHLLMAEPTKINLAGGWDTVWSAIQSAIGNQLTALLTAVGVLIVVASLFKWMWDRRRSGGGGMGQSSGVLWSLLVGATLSAPGLLIPIFLTILDAIANAVLGIWNSAAGG